jgi:hypothetical protein
MADDAVIYEQLVGELLIDPVKVSAEISDLLAGRPVAEPVAVGQVGPVVAETDLTLDSPPTTEIPVIPAAVPTDTTEITAVREPS